MSLERIWIITSTDLSSPVKPMLESHYTYKLYEIHAVSNARVFVPYYGNCPIHGGGLACNTRNDTQHLAFLLLRKWQKRLQKMGRKQQTTYQETTNNKTCDNNMHILISPAYTNAQGCWEISSHMQAYMHARTHTHMHTHTHTHTYTHTHKHTHTQSHNIQLYFLRWSACKWQYYGSETVGCWHQSLYFGTKLGRFRYYGMKAFCLLLCGACIQTAGQCKS